MLKKVLGKVDVPVFYSSLVVCLLLTLGGIFYPKGFLKIVTQINSFILDNFGWWYLLVVALFIVFCFWCVFGPYRNLKLGKDDEKPEFNNFSWFAMLFNAGIGIGFVFWGVAEPLYHYYQPPYGVTGSTPESAQMAIRLVLFHWGIHGWATYAVIGLAVAFFSYRRGLAMSVATGLAGILGDKPEESLWGKLSNFATVIATILGVGTALGLGIMQIQSGVKTLFGIPANSFSIISITIVVTCLVIFSALRGIKEGVGFFSKLNMYLTFGLLIFIFIFGPSSFILKVLINTIGEYFQNFIWMTFWTDPNGNGEWLNSWTLFYWAWWITWAPFVGCFIARISRGRTVKEFILGVLFVPTFVTLVWFSVLGGATLYAEIFEGANIFLGVQKDIGSGIFLLLDNYPFAWIMGVVVIVSLIIFFITGADAAALTIAMIVSQGNTEPNSFQKILWGGLIGAVAVVLLLSGGLGALQAAALIGGFPFSIAMVAYMWSTIQGFRKTKI